MAQDAEITDRVRALLADREVREVPMFGGLSFMVDGRMAVSARKGGDLLVRVDPDRSDDLLARPGAAQAEMGTGRSMGPGWVSVAHDSLASDDALAVWLEEALSFLAGA